MRSTILMIFTLVSLSANAVTYKELPTNFEDLSLECGTYEVFDSESTGEAIEKFTISSVGEGFDERFIRFGNSKQDYPCISTEDELICSGYAYQEDEDQCVENENDNTSICEGIEAVTESQKFFVSVSLDYNKHRSDLVEGHGTIPNMGWFKRKKTYRLVCEIEGERIYE